LIGFPRYVTLALIAAGAAPAFADVTVSVWRTEFNVSEDGRQLTQDEIVGLELTVADETGKTADFRIEGTRTDPTDSEIRLYDVSVRENQTGEWRRFCQPGPDGVAMAFPLSGTWTPSGRHEDQPTFILTCTAGAIGKCVRFGYKPWKRTPAGVSLWAYHEACTRMVRADYCGDGRSWTKDGTPIDLYDRLAVQTEDRNDGMEFEAAWGVDGAHCVRHTRIPELLTADRLATVCTRPASVANCSREMMQQDSGVLLL
jgi:ADYC domain